MLKSRQAAETLHQLVRSGRDGERTAEGFLRFAEANGLESLLPAVVRHLRTLAQRSARETTFRVATARPVPAETLSRIAVRCGAEKAPVEASVDSDLVGGFRAEYRNAVYDGSLRQYLNKLEKALTKRT